MNGGRHTGRTGLICWFLCTFWLLVAAHLQLAYAQPDRAARVDEQWTPQRDGAAPAVAAEHRAFRGEPRLAQETLDRWQGRSAEAYRNYRLSERGLHAQVVDADSPVVFGRPMPVLGIPTLSFAAVGMLMKGSSTSNLRPACTVVLAQPDVLLSAGHCLASVHADEIMWSYFPYEGLREVNLAASESFCTAAAAAEPGGCSPKIDDLAMLKLKSAYTIIRSERREDSSVGDSGAAVRIAGFGSDNEYPFDIGILRGVDAQLDTCSMNCAGSGNPATASASPRELCFTFKGSNTENPGISPFDSGGPMYFAPDPEEHGTVLGVARGSAYADCANSDLQEAKYVDLSDGYYSEWLNEKVFSDEPAPAAYRVEDLKVIDLDFLAPFVSETNDYAFELKSVPKRVIVTLNHEPGPANYRNNLDLVLPDGMNASCDRYESVEVCEADSPQVEIHTIKVGWSESCVPTEYCAHPIYDVAFQMTVVALYDLQVFVPPEPPAPDQN